MLVQWGDLNIDVWEVVKYSREAVYDGPHYLFHRHRLIVRGVINPALNAHKIQGQAVVPAPLNDRRPADRTDVAIRDLLMAPRQQLTVYSDPTPAAEALLRSPLPGYTLDASHGPMPFLYEVEEIAGYKTFHVLWGVETDLIERDALLTAAGSALLSNVWEVESDLDPNFYETRLYRGRCVFRHDRVSSLGTLPDDYRRAVLPPLFPGFKYEDARFTQEADGVTWTYQVMHRQVRQNVIAGDNITQIGLEISIEQNSPGFGEIATALAGAGTQAIVNLSFLRLNDMGKEISTAEYIAGGIIAASGIGTTLSRALPWTNISWGIVVGGNKQVTAAELLDTTKRLHDFFYKKYKKFGTTAVVKLAGDLMKSELQCLATLTQGVVAKVTTGIGELIGSVWNKVQDLIVNNRPANPAGFFSDYPFEIFPREIAYPGLSQGNLNNPLPPAGRGTRPFSSGALVPPEPNTPGVAPSAPAFRVPGDANP